MTTVKSTPESVTREQVSDLLAALGINPLDVPLGAALALGSDSISIEVLARNEDDDYFIGPDGDVARHTISIPVVES